MPSGTYIFPLRFSYPHFKCSAHLIYPSCSFSSLAVYYFLPLSFSVASSKAESWMFNIKLFPLRNILFCDWAI